jgi:hypothetical protein
VPGEVGSMSPYFNAATIADASAGSATPALIDAM